MNAQERIDDGGSIRPRVDAFLAAKLEPPVVRPSWVRRDPLVDLLEQSIAANALTLLAAPAGYGKTTLVAQWLSGSHPRGLAWVALDSADNDPARLWTHIVTALQAAGCSFPDEAGRWVAACGPDLIAGLLPTVVNAMAGIGQRVVLVLDDYHFVKARSCHDQIDFLVQHLPASASMVILTRADPALHLGRLRATQQLAEIRADQLRFDIADTSALLASQQISLGDETISELVQRTEGWPAGLYLATLSLVGRDEPEQFVHAFSGNDRFVGDYLTEEVLARQTEEVRDFIVSVSILERFSADLCDFLLQIEGSARLLHDLERSNLFLVPLDANRRWFRFHHLFAAVAHGELETDPTRDVRVLHERASDWFADHGFVEEAVGHALAAESVARASSLMQAHWIRWIDAGRTATVNGWLRTVRTAPGPPEPATLITSAWMALVMGNEPDFRELISALERMPDIGMLPDGTRSIGSAVALLTGLTGYDGPDQLLRSGQLAARLEDDPTSPWYASAQFILGHAHYVLGDLEAAIDALRRAAYSASALPMFRQLSLAALSLTTHEQGRSDVSRRAALDAMAEVESAGLVAIPQASLSFTALGVSEASVGNLTTAVAVLEEGLLLRRKIADLNPWPTIHHLLAMGSVLTSVGDLERSEHLLEETARLMSRFPDQMTAMRSRLAEARAVLRRHRSPDALTEPLTPRELDVLRLLQSTSSLSSLATELFLSPNTVKTHVKAVYRKLGATSRTEAVAIGRRRSLI
jgi:LuxR family maltose regulon positive regulatory protein